MNFVQPQHRGEQVIRIPVQCICMNEGLWKDNFFRIFCDTSNRNYIKRSLYLIILFLPDRNIKYKNFDMPGNRNNIFRSPLNCSGNQVDENFNLLVESGVHPETSIIHFDDFSLKPQLCSFNCKVIFRNHQRGLMVELGLVEFVFYLLIVSTGVVLVCTSYEVMSYSF